MAEEGNKPPMDDARLRTAFKMWDKNGSGMLEPTELRQMLMSMGVLKTSDGDITKYMQRFDLDKDDALNLKEFTALMNRIFRHNTPLEDPCQGCKQAVTPATKYLQMQDGYWHMDCFKCGTCGKPLPSDAVVFPRDDKWHHDTCLGKRCEECGDSIPVTEGYVSETQEATGKCWHSKCFRCRECNAPIQEDAFTWLRELPYHDRCTAKAQARLAREDAEREEAERRKAEEEERRRKEEEEELKRKEEETRRRKEEEARRKKEEEEEAERRRKAEEEAEAKRKEEEKKRQEEEAKRKAEEEKRKAEEEERKRKEEEERKAKEIEDARLKAEAEAAEKKRQEEEAREKAMEAERAKLAKLNKPCVKCNQTVVEGWDTQAGAYHDACLTCGTCQEKIGDQPFASRDNNLHHVRCLEHRCEVCGELVHVEQGSITDSGHHWHVDCFKCEYCKELITDDKFEWLRDKPYHAVCCDKQEAEWNAGK